MSKGDDQVWYAQNKGRMAMGSQEQPMATDRNRLVDAWLQRAKNLAGYGSIEADAAMIYRTCARELHAALAAPPVEQQAAEPELWKHKKTGGIYEWLMSAVREEDQAAVVVYRSRQDGVRWVRPSVDFYDGRFEKIAGPQSAQPAPQAAAALVEAVAKAIMFEDCGSTESWAENTNLAEAAIRVCDARNPPRCSHCHSATSAPVHPAPSQPDRAVMQQALDALQTLLSMQSEWHADFPEHVGDKEAPAMQAARAAIAALSASIGKVSEPRDG